MQKNVQQKCKFASGKPEVSKSPCFSFTNFFWKVFIFRAKV